MPERARIYVLALLAGLIADILLIAVIKTVGGEANGASILLVVEAVILGWVFGPWPGVVGSIVPIVVFLLIDLSTGSGNGSEVSIVVAVALILGFCAWLPGVLRQRYRRAR